MMINMLICNGLRYVVKNPSRPEKVIVVGDLNFEITWASAKTRGSENRKFGPIYA